MIPINKPENDSCWQKYVWRHVIVVNKAFFLFKLDLDPCDKLQCSFYAKCKAYGPYNATCVCDEDSDIPNYDDQVCSQEKVTYQNSAFLEQESCLKSRKIKVKRPGSCERKFFFIKINEGRN